LVFNFFSIRWINLFKYHFKCHLKFITKAFAITQNALRPVSKTGLENLEAKSKENPNVIKSIKVKTVCEGQFRNLTYVRNLPEHVIDEPPGLLGQDTAPNPSEAVLAALGYWRS
jgi:hypothetical protein